MSRRRKKNETDPEFQRLVSVFKGIDFVEALDMARQTTKMRLIEWALEHAAAQDPGVERADVERRVDALIAESDCRTEALSRIIDNQGMKQAEETMRRLQQCEILFSTLSAGWPATRCYYGRWHTDSSVRIVRRQCPNEVAEYKAVLREWREARRRYLATETEASWQWYTRGRGNKNSVAYRSHVDLNRFGGEEWFRTRRLFKYTISELLPRRDERRRARIEMKRADARMRRARERLLERIGVPLDIY
jgi:hypothetical protein